MNSAENWVLEIEPDIYKETRRFSLSDKQRIFDVINSLTENPYSGDVLKLSGEENRWRRRVGPFRVFYRIYQNSRKVLVVHVERRGSNTY